MPILKVKSETVDILQMSDPSDVPVGCWGYGTKTGLK